MGGVRIYKNLGWVGTVGRSMVRVLCFFVAMRNSELDMAHFLKLFEAMPHSALGMVRILLFFVAMCHSGFLPHLNRAEIWCYLEMLSGRNRMWPGKAEIKISCCKC